MFKQKTYSASNVHQGAFCQSHWTQLNRWILFRTITCRIAQVVAVTIIYTAIWEALSKLCRWSRCSGFCNGGACGGTAISTTMQDECWKCQGRHIPRSHGFYFSWRQRCRPKAHHESRDFFWNGCFCWRSVIRCISSSNKNGLIVPDWKKIKCQKAIFWKGRWCSGCYLSDSLSLPNKTFQSGATHVYSLQPNNSTLLTQIPGTECFWKNLCSKKTLDLWPLLSQPTLAKQGCNKHQEAGTPCILRFWYSAISK